MASDRITITDVARRAGVAISSASAALNDQKGVSTETRARVRDAAKSLNYVPSLRGKSLSSKRAFAIGLVVERDFTILESDPFFSAFIGGVEESLAPHGYALLLQISGRDHESLSRHLELADSRRVDGIILSELQVDDPRVAAFQARDTPVVGINPGATFPFTAVSQDSTSAIRSLITYFRDQGHERIAHVAGPGQYVHSAQRLESFTDAMHRTGLDPSLVIDGDFTHDGGARAADILLGLNERPTAVFCANDLMAIGFINRAFELGFKVPEDVSVAGFDGISLGSYIRPTLSTIATTPHVLGREAARVLLDVIEERPHSSVEIPCTELILRGSTHNAPTHKGL